MEFSAVIVVVLISAINAGKEPLSQKLHKDLLENYQVDVIPIFEKGKAVEVNFGLSLQQIHNVDTQQEVFHAAIWLNYEWKDARLSWNTTEYNGVQSLRIRTDDLWMPDIRMYNSLAAEKVFDTHVVVYADGTCSYVPTLQITSSCAYDMKWFPYDTQYCTMKYGSWTYDGTRVNLTSMYEQIDTNTYQPNRGWFLVSAKANRNVQRYQCCPEPYIDITFTVEVRRNGEYYAWQYITPAVILTFLIPVLFLLPSDNSSRFALGAGMLVTIMLLMDGLRYILPEELIDRPRIGVYYDMMFILVSLAIGLSAVISCIASKSTGHCPPHAILKTIMLNGLGRICCVTYDRKYGTPTGNEMDSDGNVKSDSQTSVERAAVYEWRLIAKVLDRLFFVVFVLVVFIGSLAVLPQDN